MHGNVWEWCQDHWHENYQDAPTDGGAWIDDKNKASHVLRGGSWFYVPLICRSAARGNDTRNFRDRNFGFRVVCEIPKTV